MRITKCGRKIANDSMPFLHYIEEGLSLSAIKQISNAEKHHNN